jgi:hypothetical protein
MLDQCERRRLGCNVESNDHGGKTGSLHRLGPVASGKSPAAMTARLLWSDWSADRNKSYYAVSRRHIAHRSVRLAARSKLGPKTGNYVYFAANVHSAGSRATIEQPIQLKSC